MRRRTYAPPGGKTDGRTDGQVRGTHSRSLTHKRKRARAPAAAAAAVAVIVVVRTRPLSPFARDWASFARQRRPGGMRPFLNWRLADVAGVWPPTCLSLTPP